MFEFNSNNTKKILLIITYTLILAFVLFNISAVGTFLGFILGLLKPFIVGFCFAFVLNIFVCKIENLLLGKNKKKRKNMKAAAKKPVVENEIPKVNTGIRVLSISISLLLMLGIILAVLFLVIPEFVHTIAMFKDSIPQAFNTTKAWILDLIANNPDMVERIKSITLDWTQLDSNLTEIIKKIGSGLLGTSIDAVLGVFSGVITTFMGIIFSIYMLAQKETLINQCKRLFVAYFKEEKANKIFHIGDLVNDTFKKFFSGQFVEAILLGVACFIGMNILKMPYAFAISALVGVTALIPVFGAFFGTAIGAILIAAVSPIKALEFIAFIIIWQQIDNNLIYPRVVGNSVGLPGIWVMLAVLVGGNGFGVIGMLVAVPIASVIYKLLGEYVKNNNVKIGGFKRINKVEPQIKNEK